MGDTRFEEPYRRVAEATDRLAVLDLMTSEEVVMALAGASRAQDPLLANVLATEAMNRARRSNVVLDNIAEGIVAVDAQRRVTFANPAALDLLGYARDDLIGQDFHELVHGRAGGDHVPLDECVIAETLATGRTASWRDHGDGIRRKDGTFFPAKLTSAPIERDGERVGAVIVVSDITREMEDDVAIGRLAAVVEHAADAILTLSPEGVVTHANGAVGNVLGHDPASLEGRHVLEIVPAEAHAAAREVLERIRSGQAVRQAEMPHRHADGRVVLTSLTVFPIHDRGGRLAAISGILRDVTEERRAQQRQEAAHARERQLHRGVRYRLTTLLPAVAWGLGTIILLRTLVLLWFAFTPVNWADTVVLAATTLALLVGGLVGALVYLRQRARARQARHA